jgi:hypothetical protein
MFEINQDEESLWAIHCNCASLPSLHVCWRVGMPPRKFSDEAKHSQKMLFRKKFRRALVLGFESRNHLRFVIVKARGNNLRIIDDLKI